jgi:Lhr-like helicase
MSSSRSDLARMMPDAFPVFFTGRQPYPGQATVMPEVVRGHNVLFAAPTASGKTEAAVRRFIRDTFPSSGAVSRPSTSPRRRRS